MYNACDVGTIADFFGCSAISIYQQAYKIRLKKEKKITGRQWSDDHKRIMFELWPDKNEIAQRVGRSVNTVSEYARRNGLKTGIAAKREWTKEEDDLLQELYLSVGRGKVSKKMGLSEHVVRGRIEKLGIEAPKRERKKRWLKSVPNWTSGEVELLKYVYPTLQNYELEKLFKRKFGTICAKAKSLGLSKAEDFIADIHVIGSRNKYRDIYLNHKQLFQLKRMHHKLRKAIKKTNPEPKCRHEYKGERKWTEAEERFIIDNRNLTYADMAKYLDRSFPSIASRVQVLLRKGEIQPISTPRYNKNRASNGRFKNE